LSKSSIFNFKELLITVNSLILISAKFVCLLRFSLHALIAVDAVDAATEDSLLNADNSASSVATLSVNVFTCDASAASTVPLLLASANAEVHSNNFACTDASVAAIVAAAAFALASASAALFFQQQVLFEVLLKLLLKHFQFLYI